MLTTQLLFGTGWTLMSLLAIAVAIANRRLRDEDWAGEWCGEES